MFVARSPRTLIISETPKRTTPSNAGFVCRENNLSIERSSQFVDARVQYQIEPSTGRIEATYEKQPSLCTSLAVHNQRIVLGGHSSLHAPPRSPGPTLPEVIGGPPPIGIPTRCPALPIPRSSLPAALT